MRAEATHLNSELLDDGGGGSLGGVVEDLVDPLVDDLGRHGGSEDNGALGTVLGPKVGSSLGASELAPNIDVVCRNQQSSSRKRNSYLQTNW
jgi:hypothetical protein